MRTLNTILSLGFPLWHFPALLRYLLSSYDHSFLELFVISQLSLNIFQSFCFSVMLFCNTPNIVPKSLTFFSIWYITWSLYLSPSPLTSVYIFSWLKSKIPFCLNCSIFLLISYYCSTCCNILCFSSSITVFRPSLLTLYLSFNSLNLRFLFNPSSVLIFLSIKLTSCLSLFICSSMLRFHLGSILFLCSAPFKRICPVIRTLAAMIILFVCVMLLLSRYLIASWLYLFEASKPFFPLS